MESTGDLSAAGHLCYIIIYLLFFFNWLDLLVVSWICIDPIICKKKKKISFLCMSKLVFHHHLNSCLNACSCVMCEVLLKCITSIYLFIKNV